MYATDPGPTAIENRITAQPGAASLSWRAAHFQLTVHLGTIGRITYEARAGSW